MSSLSICLPFVDNHIQVKPSDHSLKTRQALANIYNSPFHQLIPIKIAVGAEFFACLGL